MTLTLIPAAMQWVIAGRPARVPGILIIALGRSTARQSRSASWIVPSVSCASVGETSSDTSPSPPPVGLVHRREEVAGGAHVGHRQRLEDLTRALSRHR